LSIALLLIVFCIFSEAAAAAQTPATTPNAATGAATAAAAAAPATTTVRTVPVQITVPPQAGVAGHTAAKSITVHVPAHALQGYFPIESRSY
jgi:hypothetical protein